MARQDTMDLFVPIDGRRAETRAIHRDITPGSARYLLSTFGWSSLTSRRYAACELFNNPGGITSVMPHSRVSAVPAERSSELPCAAGLVVTVPSAAATPAGTLAGVPLFHLVPGEHIKLGRIVVGQDPEGRTWSSFAEGWLIEKLAIHGYEISYAPTKQPYPTMTVEAASQTVRWPRQEWDAKGNIRTVEYAIERRQPDFYDSLGYGFVTPPEIMAVVAALRAAGEPEWAGEMLGGYLMEDCDRRVKWSDGALDILVGYGLQMFGVNVQFDHSNMPTTFSATLPSKEEIVGSLSDIASLNLSRELEYVIGIGIYGDVARPSDDESVIARQGAIFSWWRARSSIGATAVPDGTLLAVEDALGLILLQAGTQNSWLPGTMDDLLLPQSQLGAGAAPAWRTVRGVLPVGELAPAERQTPAPNGQINGGPTANGRR